MLVLLLMLSINDNPSAEVNQTTELSSDTKANLEKTLEKEGIANQRFAELVKSTLKLMSPQDAVQSREKRPQISTP